MSPGTIGPAGLAARAALKAAAACWILATAGGTGSAAGQATLSDPPPVPLGAPPELRLPEVREFALPNGLPVRLVELHALPVVHVSLLVRSAAATEPLELAGVADLTADMLDAGTATRDAIELAEALEHLGAQLSTGAGWDASSIGLHVASARLEPALELMAEVALRPSFPAEELERKRVERLTDLLLARDVPAAVAGIALTGELYPETHRYRTRAGGTAATIERLEREDLERFYREHYVPGNAALVVVGDVGEEELRPLLEAAFADWRGAGPPGRALPEAPQVERTRIVLVDRPASEQSEVRIARVGPPRSTEDYVRIVVLNTLLGGSFTSRLNQNLREAHGYAYGAGSAFDLRLGPGPVLASAPVHTAVTDSAVVEFLRELRRVREETPGAEEVEKAKRYVALSFPSRFETTREVAARLAELVVYDLPEDFYDTFVERVSAVTPEEVQATARSYLDPDASLIGVVGDAAAIRPGLAGLGLGDLELLTIQDVMGPPPRIPQHQGEPAH